MYSRFFRAGSTLALFCLVACQRSSPEAGSAARASQDSLAQVADSLQNKPQPQAEAAQALGLDLDVWEFLKYFPSYALGQAQPLFWQVEQHGQRMLPADLAQRFLGQRLAAALDSYQTQDSEYAFYALGHYLLPNKAHALLHLAHRKGKVWEHQWLIFDTQAKKLLDGKNIEQFCPKASKQANFSLKAEASLEIEAPSCTLRFDAQAGRWGL